MRRRYTVHDRLAYRDPLFTCCQLRAPDYRASSGYPQNTTHRLPLEKTPENVVSSGEGRRFSYETCVTQLENSGGACTSWPGSVVRRCRRMFPRGLVPGTTHTCEPFFIYRFLFSTFSSVNPVFFPHSSFHI